MHQNLAHLLTVKMKFPDAVVVAPTFANNRPLFLHGRRCRGNQWLNAAVTALGGLVQPNVCVERAVAGTVGDVTSSFKHVGVHAKRFEQILLKG